MRHSDFAHGVVARHVRVLEVAAGRLRPLRPQEPALPLPAEHHALPGRWVGWRDRPWQTLAKYSILGHAAVALVPLVLWLPYTLTVLPVFSVVAAASVYGFKSGDSLALIPFQLYLVSAPNCSDQCSPGSAVRAVRPEPAGGPLRRVPLPRPHLRPVPLR